ncbi:MAG: hypothetical protein AAF629_14985 [Chloroflexota bacterium]
MNQQSPEQKITHHLEMSSRDALNPAKEMAVDFDLKRVEIPCPEFN